MSSAIIDSFLPHILAHLDICDVGMMDCTGSLANSNKTVTPVWEDADLYDLTDSPTVIKDRKYRPWALPMSASSGCLHKK